VILEKCNYFELNISPCIDGYKYLEKLNLKIFNFTLMKSLLTWLMFMIFFSTTYGQEEKVELWNFEQLNTYMDSPTKPSKLKVINFWATWCAPCIKEMPYFEEVTTSYQNSVEVLFVCIDFSDELENVVIPFLKGKDLISRLIILTDNNYNEWINRVDSSWTGAIPATMFIPIDGHRVFHESAFEREELIDLIEELRPKNNKP